MLVDDLSKVQNILSELHKANGLPESAEFNKLLSLTSSWQDMDQAEKNRTFSAYSSYELHLYLKRWDKPYFEEVVRSFI